MNHISKCDVLLVTVTDVETESLLETAKSQTGRRYTTELGQYKTYFDLGIIGGARTFVVKSEMGSDTIGGSLITVKDAIAEARPSAVIMVGISFGVDQKKQKIGEVLVASQIQAYDLQRVGTTDTGTEKIILRGDKPHSSEKLLDRFRTTGLYWKKAKVSFGLVLSGEKLVDNIDFRDQLRALSEEAIGGEMEGAGLYVACQQSKVDWILVKAICDWADGKKGRGKKQKQKVAGQNAAGFVMEMLSSGLLSQQPPRAVRAACDYGGYVPEMCDRDLQENQFSQFFKTNLNNQRGKPQVYFLEGEDQERHHSLVNHLIINPMIPIAEKLWGDQQGVVIDQECSWPHYGELAHSQQHLTINLFKELDPAYADVELTATALRKSVAARLYPMLVIKHYIDARGWRVTTRRLIEWYLSYWDEIRPNTDGPQFLIFISIIYPDMRKRWSVTKRIKKRRVQRGLAKIVSSPAGRRLCCRLEELKPVTKIEAQAWFNKYHPCYAQKQCDVLGKLYAHDDKISMSELQLSLETIHKECSGGSVYARQMAQTLHGHRLDYP